MDKKIFGKFYSPMRALSYGRNIIVSIGSRSIGKTTGWLLWATDRAIHGNGEHKFVYLRRRQSDIEATAKDALNNVEIIFHNNHLIEENDTFIYEHGKYYFVHGKEKEEIGQSLALSLSTRKKSSSIGSQGYDLMIYDECICEYESDYIGSSADPEREYKLLINLFITLARKVGVAFNDNFYLVCIGNASTYLCPVILGLGADKWLTPETRYLAPKGKHWLVEQTPSVEATVNGSDILQELLSDEDYAYNLRGETLDSNALVDKSIYPKLAIYACSFRGNYIGIYRNEDFIVCSEKKNTLPIIALTYNDGRIDREYAPQKSSLARILKEAFNSGKLVFSSQKMKQLILTYIKYC